MVISRIDGHFRSTIFIPQGLTRYRDHTDDEVRLITHDEQFRGLSGYTRCIVTAEWFSHQKMNRLRGDVASRGHDPDKIIVDDTHYVEEVIRNIKTQNQLLQTQG